jgi:hypothetical protein
MSKNLISDRICPRCVHVFNETKEPQQVLQVPLGKHTHIVHVVICPNPECDHIVVVDAELHAKSCCCIV